MFNDFCRYPELTSILMLTNDRVLLLEPQARLRNH